MQYVHFINLYLTCSNTLSKNNFYFLFRRTIQIFHRLLYFLPHFAGRPLQQSPFALGPLHFIMLVILSVISGHWLLTRRGGSEASVVKCSLPLHSPHLSATVMESRVQKLYFPCGHSSILWVICSTQMAKLLNISQPTLLDKVPSVSASVCKLYRKQRQDAIAMGDLFSATVMMFCTLVQLQWSSGCRIHCHEIMGEPCKSYLPCLWQYIFPGMEKTKMERKTFSQ